MQPILWLALWSIPVWAEDCGWAAGARGAHLIAGARILLLAAGGGRVVPRALHLHVIHLCL